MGLAEQTTSRSIKHSASSDTLADVLERILDKGVVVAADINVWVSKVQLLDIKINLLIASVDKAKEIGCNWWEHDGYFSSSETQKLEKEKEELEQKVKRLEAQQPEKKKEHKKKL